MSSAKWFYVRNNQAHGPVSREFILDGIKTGEIQLFDLVFQEGGSQWRTVAECEELRFAGETKATPEPKEWVVLRATEESGETQYRQQGPYSASEIYSAIHRGQISFRDYGWKPGFKKWVRLGEIENFDRRTQTAATLDLPVVPKPPELSQDEILASVVQLKPVSSDKIFADPDPVPMEAKEASTGGKVTLQAKDNPVNMPPKPKPDLRVIKGGKVKAKVTRHYGFKMRVGFAAGFAILISSILYFSVLESPVKAPTVAVQKPIPVRTIARNISSVQAAPQPVAQPVQPSLKIVPLNLAGDNPELVFQTNAPVGTPIEAWVVGKTGRILELPSFHAALKMQRQNGEVPTLDLTSLNMPRGEYQVTVQAGALLAKATIFKGQDDADFQHKLTRIHKRLAPLQHQEKVAMMRLNKGFQGAWKSMALNYERHHRHVPKWRQFYQQWQKKWRGLSNKGLEISVQNSNRFAFPEYWVELKEIRKEISQQASELNRSVLQKRTLASVGNPELEKRMTTLQKRLVKLAR